MMSAMVVLRHRSPTGPRVLFVTEARLIELPTGEIVSPDGVNGDQQWADYCRVIKNLRLAARVEPVSSHRDVNGRVTIPRVMQVRHYSGLKGLIPALPGVVRNLDRAVRDCDLLVVRVPGLLGYIAVGIARVRGVPFASELVGDPADVLRALYGTSLPVSLAAETAAWMLRRVARGSRAVRYVTHRVLQEKYPAREGAPVVAFGNVILEDGAFATRNRCPEPGGRLRLLVIGSQNTTYKGHDVAMKVVQALRPERDVTLTVIGGGTLHGHYRELAVTLGVDDVVEFKGHVTDRQAVWAAIDEADVLLMPSRTEGLPRVVNEAHARSLPVIGTAVGGIPEMLPENLLVPVDDIDGFVRCIRALVDDPDRYREAASFAAERTADLDASRRAARFDEWARILLRSAEIPQAPTERVV